jgi:hypothetical protein
MTSSSNLRDTLSSFGDDLVRVKDTNFLYFESEGGGGALPVGSAGQNQQYQSGMQFQRVPSGEVGIKSSRWRKAIVAGLFTSSPSSQNNFKHRNNNATNLRNTDEYSEDNNNDTVIKETPPFWGVGLKIRKNISMLSLQLMFHELACFASCVLLGCLIVQLIKGVKELNN